MPMNEAIQRTCTEYRRMMVVGEDPSDIVGWLAAEAGVNRPAIWRRLRSGGVLPPYNAGPKLTLRRGRRKRSEIIREKAGQARVKRDPCPRCGVRADHGCEHHAERLGMVFG